jgi:8-oxo-dGTP diphosphatase
VFASFTGDVTFHLAGVLHASDLARDGLRHGRIIAERYLNSAIANHAAVHQLANDTVANVIAPFTSYLIIPDLTIYLHTSPTELARRMHAKPDQTRSDHDLLTDPGSCNGSRTATTRSPLPAPSPGMCTPPADPGRAGRHHHRDAPSSSGSGLSAPAATAGRCVRGGNVAAPATTISRRSQAMPATETSYRPHVGVHLVLTANGKVLLLRRANTGFADGSWSLPGGCLDEGETLPAAATREALEEVGVTIDPANLAFVHLCHHADPDGQSRIGVFFTATRWTGDPVNAEPGKCSEIGWHDMSDLPSDIVSYISTGLQACTRNETLSVDSW